MAEEHEDPTRGQLVSTHLGNWAGLSKLELGPIFFSKLVDFGLPCFSVDAAACALSTVLLSFQIQAIFDSTILPLYMPAVGLNATTASGGFVFSPSVVSFPSGCLDLTSGVPFFWLIFWWN